MAAAEHPRYIAALTREHYEAYLVGWWPGDSDPTPRQQGAANLVYKGCVAACAPSVPQVAVASSVAPAAPLPANDQARMVKLNLTVDPSREDSRPVMSQKEVEDAYRTYHKVMGAPPAPHEEATQEHIRCKSTLKG
eukprot:3336936-Amphidinium_carterae.1